MTTCSTTSLGPVADGDALVVAVAEFTPFRVSPTAAVEVASGGNHSLALIAATNCTGAVRGEVSVYALANATGSASAAFTVTFASTAYYTIEALDARGTVASPFEAPGSAVCATHPGTSVTASVTTTVANDLVLEAVEVEAAEPISASGGDQVVTQATESGANPTSGALLQEPDPSTGSVGLAASFASARYSAIAIAIVPPSPLVPGTVSPGVSSLDAGQSLALTSTPPTGGTGSYSYQWYNTTGSCASGAAIAGATGLSYATPALGVGAYAYCLAATDVGTAQVVYTNVATVSVNPALTVSITPSSPTIDPGQTVVLTAHPGGGTGADAYAWYSGAACTGTALASTQAYTTPPLASASSYCVAVTDSSSEPATADSTDTVSVATSALNVAVAPSAPSIDSGQSVTLTATPSGGTGADAYAWYAGASCVGPVLAITPLFTTPTLTSAATYCVAVTDSAYQPVTATATDTVTVSATALNVTVTPPSPSLDNGQSVTLTATPTGGTGTDSYAWYAGGSCSGAVLAATAAFPTGPLTATATYCVAVTDSAYQPVTATATDTVIVSAAALNVTVTPPSPSIDNGQSITLSAVPTGGTGTDSYAWYAGGSCSGTVLATTADLVSGPLTATTTFCVAVTDSAYLPVTASATVSAAVSASPLSVVVTPVAPTIDVGQAITLTAHPVGGTGAFGYAWFAGLVCSGTVLATSELLTTASLTVSQSYCVRVTDSAFAPDTASATVNVSVSATALGASVVPDQPGVDSGQSIALTAIPTGGTGPYSYAWYTGASCTGPVLSDGATMTTPALESTTTFCVLVSDSAFASTNVTVTDTVTVSAGGLSITVTPPQVALDNGQAAHLHAHVQGGTGAVVVSWYASANCAGPVVGSSPQFNSAALFEGTTFCAAATDSAAAPETVTALAEVTISPALSVAVAPPNPTLDPGQGATLVASATGGTLPVTYAWYLGASCSGTPLASSARFTTPALSENTTYCVQATDSAATPSVANASDSLAVGAKALGVAISPEPLSVHAGQPFNLTANVSGGTAPYRYDWYAGPNCSGTILSNAEMLTPNPITAATSYCVEVTDSALAPENARANETVTVQSSSPPPSTVLGLTGGQWELLGLGLVALLAVGLLLLLASRRRRRTTGAPTTEAPSASPSSNANSPAPSSPSEETNPSSWPERSPEDLNARWRP